MQAIPANPFAPPTDNGLNNGMPGRSEMHRLGINVVLENQMSFYGDLQGNQYTLNAAGNGIFYQMVLRGLYARGVQ